jgi:hypothetical protein
MCLDWKDSDTEINRKSMFVMKEYLNYFWNIL